MAIESAIIVAGPTVSRAEVRVHCLRMFDAVPNALTPVREWNRTLGQWKAIVLPRDEVSGMIAVQPSGSDIAYLYVAVNQVWKSVHISQEVIDPGTGKPWDPLAQFYSPLAS